MNYKPNEELINYSKLLQDGPESLLERILGTLYGMPYHEAQKFGFYGTEALIASIDVLEGLAI
jgi:hypothetical protein